MRRSSFISVLAVPGALVACSEPDQTPIVTAIAVAPCAPSPALDELEVMAQGTVVDLLTGAPRAGVTVDIARAWEPDAGFPADSCSVGRLTTDAQGNFGPIAVRVGPRPSLLESKFILFLAQGDDISPTASDARVPTGSSAIEHRIEAPALDLIDEWRTVLDDGGMASARTRGLIAYRYDEPDGTPAADVIAQHAGFLGNRTFERGDEVRYLSPDRASIEPPSRSTTTASGLALIGVTPSERGTIEIGGARSTDDWGSIGCLVGEGWVFFEWTRQIER